MITFPCAKINLGLNVVSRRTDGYHNLETVFYPVNISDRIEITVADGRMPEGKACALTVEGMPVTGNADDNLVVKAYNMLAKDYSLPHVHINLCKKIPMQAGMGGGSSDCAYTIRMLNDMFGLDIPTERMIGYAASLGADCAFFINPVPSYAEGIGDVLQPADIDLSGYRIVIVKPDIPVSTREAFSLITPAKPFKCCRDIVRQPIDTWRDELVNDFEKSIFALHPEIAAIKQRLYDTGAIYAAMSGSGSALFGIFKDVPADIRDMFKDCFVAIL
ncbi:4-(cytidine 5'-diphospho)-2-C-methyl-D-erythritol kinase [Xylanibacter caecicola]|uniref:4-(cytidine 5'-diphospho)-2-C-methyl-D-erythritol kinase n=1 Tax=Xylanibacter caecicola TaxID=2736294 RepID=UPI0025892445|nr:4-(cytidine 5'-diphospho)-2-C-methyl-D-erythritol kinase [Xylanibacter caecicola]